MSVRMVRNNGSGVGPRLICDQCLGAIERTSDASAEWRVSDVPEGAVVFFTHNACTRAFRSARGGQSGWSWARFEDFHFRLAKSLGMQVELSPGTPLYPYRVHGEILDVPAEEVAALG
jgi:hypothetical protein